jgi:hypothetical protein
MAETGRANFDEHIGGPQIGGNDRPDDERFADLVENRRLILKGHVCIPNSNK